MRAVHRCLLALVLLWGVGGVWAEEARPYTEGVVLRVGYVRTKYGMFEEYMRYLSGPYRKLMDQAKKDGLIVDWAVYETTASNPQDPDIILTTVYRNWAAFDGLREKLDPIQKMVFGSLDAASKGAVDRDKMREALGGRIMQQLEFK